MMDAVSPLLIHKTPLKSMQFNCRPQFGSERSLTVLPGIGGGGFNGFETHTPIDSPWRRHKPDELDFAAFARVAPGGVQRAEGGQRAERVPDSPIAR